MRIGRLSSRSDVTHAQVEFICKRLLKSTSVHAPELAKREAI